MDHMISGYSYAFHWLGSAVINVYALHFIFHIYSDWWLSSSWLVCSVSMCAYVKLSFKFMHAKNEALLCKTLGDNADPIRIIAILSICDGDFQGK